MSDPFKKLRGLTSDSTDDDVSAVILDLWTDNRAWHKRSTGDALVAATRRIHRDSGWDFADCVEFVADCAGVMRQEYGE